MKVVELKWISKSGKEAELIVSDGVHECLVFSQPCKVQLNQSLSEPLHALDVDEFMTAISGDNKEKIIKLDESYFSHYCIAKIDSIDNSIVSVGDILIELEGIMPSWAKEGDLVTFKCARLDIW
jgi:hypothetical protein